MTATKTAKPKPIIVWTADLGARERSLHSMIGLPGNGDRKAALLEEQAAALEATQGLIRDALDAVNGRASSFATTSPVQVRGIARVAEERLEAAGITKANRSGAVVRHRGAGPSANAYKYAAKATLIELRRDSKGTWLLVKAEASSVHPKQAELLDIVISEAAAEDAKRAAIKPFVVAQQKAGS